MSVLSLPDDCLREIFRRLPILCLVRTINRVSTRWKDLSQETYLYKRATIQPEYECLNLWRHASLPEGLELDDDYEDITGQLSFISGQYGNCSITVIFYSLLDPYTFHFLSRYPCSCAICAWNYNMDLPQMRELLNAGYVFNSHTKEINLGYRTCIDFDILSEILSKTPNLEKLTIGQRHDIELQRITQHPIGEWTYPEYDGAHGWAGRMVGSDFTAHMDLGKNAVLYEDVTFYNGRVHRAREIRCKYRTFSIFSSRLYPCLGFQ